MSDVTRILDAIEAGNTQASEQLLPLLYDELRSMAASKMAHEAAGQTLDATALVHEAYLRLVDKQSPQQWNSRGHFFGAAAEAMRRILIERARHKKCENAGGEYQRVALSDIQPAIDEPDVDLWALDEALDQLEQMNPRQAKLVKLRFFAGLTTTQAAEALDISTSTADNDWAYARCWLRVQMAGKPA